VFRSILLQLKNFSTLCQLAFPPALAVYAGHTTQCMFVLVTAAVPVRYRCNIRPF